ncbi:unnamed protein product [Brachionus calyciflorus]|uniref:Uncharacterized protein n=1 Tax=Brachionus calyciflorus TaxID=104777 RepID=A0A813V5R3_9BILA|nr:unnamed protein product [Brachionus calyciflorus]
MEIKYENGSECVREGKRMGHKDPFVAEKWVPKNSTIIGIELAAISARQIMCSSLSSNMFSPLQSIASGILDNALAMLFDLPGLQKISNS